MANIIKKFAGFFNTELLLLIFCWGIMGFFYVHVSRVNAKTMPAKNLEISTDSSGHERLKEMLGLDYEVFVKELGKNIDDPKFLAALNAGDRVLDKVEFDHEAEYRVCDLIPTQNEIDVDKSLKYPLSKETESALMDYLEAKSSFAPGGSPIVTAGGKYIIDGHHRWSQLYLINPSAKIKAINIKIDDPKEALKFVQLAIASVSGKIPTAIVEGKNLLTMTQTDFKNWISGNISENAISAFKKTVLKDKNESDERARLSIIDYIWGNAKKMQSQNYPVAAAPNRGIMPQTDKAEGWDKLLQEGKIDVRD